MTKEQLEQRLKKLLKMRVVFVILSSVFLGIAVTCDIASIIIYLSRIEIAEYINLLILEASSIFFAASIALFFVRIFAIDTKIRNTMFAIAQQSNNQFVNFGNVSIKAETTPNQQQEVIKDQKHQLVDQYEDLKNRGYITEEEFLQKKKEILGEQFIIYNKNLTVVRFF